MAKYDFSSWSNNQPAGQMSSYTPTPSATNNMLSNLTNTTGNAAYSTNPLPFSDMNGNHMNDTNLLGQDMFGNSQNSWGDFTNGLSDAFSFGEGQGGGWGMLGGLGSLGSSIAGAVMAKNQLGLQKDMFSAKLASTNNDNRINAQILNDNARQRQIANVHQEGLSQYSARRGGQSPEEILRQKQITPTIIGA